MLTARTATFAIEAVCICWTIILAMEAMQSSWASAYSIRHVADGTIRAFAKLKTTIAPERKRLSNTYMVMGSMLDAWTLVLDGNYHFQRTLNFYVSRLQVLTCQTLARPPPKTKS